MDYIEICENDYNAFYELASAYYREDEDADTPQEEIDTFICFMFEKVINHEINGYIAKDKMPMLGLRYGELILKILNLVKFQVSEQFWRLDLYLHTVRKVTAKSWYRISKVALAKRK